MDLDHAMRTTGAVRAFSDTPVTPGTLYRILDRARFAPSGGNQQGWHVTVVRDLALRRELGERSAHTWARYMAESQAGYRAYNPIDPAPTDLPVADDLPRNPMLDHLVDVPEVLIVSVDLRVLAVLDHELDRFSLVGGGSIYPFCQNILLSARNEGLGAVLTTFVVASEADVGPLLGLPDHHGLVAMICLGTPVHQVTKLSRRPVETFTTIDRFDGTSFTGDP